MSDERTNRQLAAAVLDDVDPGCMGDSAANALAELTHRAEEAAVYRRALENELTNMASFPCMSIGLIHDTKSHHVCPLGRDMAECWTFDGETVTVRATDRRPPHPSCATHTALNAARKALAEEADE